MVDSLGVRVQRSGERVYGSELDEGPRLPRPPFLDLTIPLFRRYLVYTSTDNLIPRVLDVRTI